MPAHVVHDVPTYCPTDCTIVQVTKLCHVFLNFWDQLYSKTERKKNKKHFGIKIQFKTNNNMQTRDKYKETI